MKVMQVEIMKILPDKMAKAMELLEKQLAIQSQLGAPPGRTYRGVSAQRKHTQTLVIERDWDNFTAMEAFAGRMLTAPDFQELTTDWATVLESQKAEFYTPVTIGV